MAVLQPIWVSEIIGGMLLMCQNTTTRVYGPWIKTYFVFCVQKRVVAMGMCYNPALVRDKPLGSPASVKRVFGGAPQALWEIPRVSPSPLFISLFQHSSPDLAKQLGWIPGMAVPVLLCLNHYQCDKFQWKLHSCCKKRISNRNWFN